MSASSTCAARRSTSAITHFDLANNYGPPPGSAETAFGDILRTDFAGLRDELIISSKAGYDMWPGPYGEWGSRKVPDRVLRPEPCAHGSRLRSISSIRIALIRKRRWRKPALRSIISSARAGRFNVGISSYNSQRTREAAAILKDLGTPLIIHQPSYSMLNRWVEDDGLVDTLDDVGAGSIVFSPLAQGMLTTKYLGGIPADSRAAQNHFLKKDFIRPSILENIRKLNEIAEKARPDLGADGDRLGAAGRPYHLGADRRQPLLADRRLRGSARQRHVHSRKNWRKSISTRRKPT